MKKSYILWLALSLLVLTLLGFYITQIIQPKYKPNTKEALILLVNNNRVKLGNIDTSKITDMSALFMESKRSDFSGIESWDVSNVKDMSSMFQDAENFNKNIGSWNVSNVENMNIMFYHASNFNQDISSWHISHYLNTLNMFNDSPLENNLPFWYGM